MIVFFFGLRSERSFMAEMFRLFQEKKNHGAAEFICRPAGVFSYGNREGQYQTR
jgi:hypothetical protein